MQATAAVRKPTASVRGLLTTRRPKLSALAVSLGAALLLAHLVLGLSLIRQPDTRRQLDASLANTKALLNTNQAQLQGDLNPVLAKAQADLAAVQGALPDRVQTTPFLDQLYATADRIGVTLSNVQNKKSREVTIGQHKYVLAPFVVTAIGEVEALVTFTNALENVHQHTVVVRTVQLSEGSPNNTLIAELDIYTRAPEPANSQAPSAKPTAIPAGK